MIMPEFKKINFFLCFLIAGCKPRFNLSGYGRPPEKGDLSRGAGRLGIFLWRIKFGLSFHISHGRAGSAHKTGFCKPVFFNDFVGFNRLSLVGAEIKHIVVAFHYFPAVVD